MGEHLSAALSFDRPNENDCGGCRVQRVRCVVDEAKKKFDVHVKRPSRRLLDTWRPDVQSRSPGPTAKEIRDVLPTGASTGVIEVRMPPKRGGLP